MEKCIKLHIHVEVLVIKSSSYTLSVYEPIFGHKLMFRHVNIKHD